MNDKSLAVRYSAAVALEKLLQQKDLKNHFAPNLKEILIKYLNLCNEYENEMLLDSFKQVLSIYTEEIAEYAYDLISSLNDLFLK